MSRSEKHVVKLHIKKQLESKNKMSGIMIFLWFALGAILGLHCSAAEAKIGEQVSASMSFRLGSLRNQKNDRQPREFSFRIPKVLDLRPAELQRREPKPKPQTYGVIVDCGSSGTRAHIYHWDSEIEFSLEMLHDIEPLRDLKDGKPVTHKVQPGLSTFANSTRQQRIEYIKPLIDFIASNIPESRHQFTGVYFMATAGMRLLDKLDRESIMNNIRQFVRDNYKFNSVETCVISGKDEGMYQWISINAKSKRFLGEDTDVKTKTYAVIEMGGASVQVTYQLRYSLGQLTARSIPLKARPIYWQQLVEPAISLSDVLDSDYLLHSTTFLGLGVNSARDAYLDLLINEQRSKSSSFVDWIRSHLPECLTGGGRKNGEGDDDDDQEELELADDRSAAQEEVDQQQQQQQQQQQETNNAGESDSKLQTSIEEIEEPDYEFEDPCLPKGYRTSEALKKPIRMLNKGHRKRTIGYLIGDNDKTFSFRLRGTGDYRRCKSLLQQLIRVAKKEKLFCKKRTESKCTMSLLKESFVPFHRFDFLAISGFYYAFTSSIVNASSLYDYKLVRDNTRNICETPHEDLMRLYGDANKEEHITSACFRALWAYVFLVKGLKMPRNFDMLSFKNKINNDDLDWTLGAIIEKSIAIERST